MRKALELEQALALLTQGVEPMQLLETHISQLQGRVLAADVTAPIDQPPFPRSPLDGYALRAADSTGASKDNPVRLKVVAKHYAGDAGDTEIGPGQAVRLFTGAVIPKGADCVLRQEDTDEGEDTVEIYHALSPWDNYVYPGEDFKENDLLIPAGTVPDYAVLGVLASAGVSMVTTRRYPSAAVISTGDELVSPGTWPLPAGKIYNSNAPLLTARLSEWNIANDCGYVQDDPEQVALKIKEFLLDHELIITTGGVSVGQKDFMPQALELLGAETVFHGVRLKPGSPALFARLDGRYILALSGNPFAAATTMELLAKPLLYALTQDPRLETKRLTAPLDTPFPKASRGRRFLRGKYANGRITLPKGHSSGQLASLVGCNCLVDIPAGSGPVEAGQEVEIVLL